MHSFVSCYVHCVFSTKQRQPLIHAELQERLWPYFGGIARENQMKALCVGGVADHVHVLLSAPVGRKSHYGETLAVERRTLAAYKRERVLP